jgi:site-specific recombinase XerD
VDLEIARGIGWVRRGKGGKDRPFIIAQCLNARLGEHVRATSGGYVFKGRNGHLTVRSVQEIVKHSAKKAGIAKNIHPHSLRHSFATHLIENGYDVVAVQPLMGHTSAETTNTYIHMASPVRIGVKSPYDCIIKENNGG